MIERWCNGKPLVKPDLSRPSQDVSLDMKIGRMVTRCNYRIKPSCGCPGNPHTCTHPDKSGEKWYLDCYQCKLSEIRSG